MRERERARERERDRGGMETDRGSCTPNGIIIYIFRIFGIFVAVNPLTNGYHRHVTIWSIHTGKPQLCDYQSRDG